MIKLFTRKTDNYDHERDIERAYWRKQREEARRRERKQREAMLRAEKHERLYAALMAMQAARAEFEALAETGAVDVDTALWAWETLLGVEQWVAEEVSA